MNMNPDMIDQLLNNIPYPIGKTELVNMAKQHGANDQIAGLLDHLPDKTYNNANELKGDFGGILGKFGNLGGGFKF